MIKVDDKCGGKFVGLISPDQQSSIFQRKVVHIRCWKNIGKIPDLGRLCPVVLEINCLIFSSMACQESWYLKTRVHFKIRTFIDKHVELTPGSHMSKHRKKMYRISSNTIEERKNTSLQSAKTSSQETEILIKQQMKALKNFQVKIVA